MSNTKVIKVKPDVLKSLRYYARQRTTAVLEHFEKKSKSHFGVDDAYLKKIESSENELSLALLKELANLYKFPLTCFLLPKPLKDDLVPPDYRRIASSERGVISPKAALVLRAAQRAQFAITELGEIPAEELLKAHSSSDVEKIASDARNFLSRAFATQKRSSNPYKFFMSLRNNLEELGIVVFKMSFPLEDARAFSITNQKPYVIVINNKDGTEYGYSPKVFSLLHEFGHIVLRDGGLCNDFSTDNTIRQEIFCNSFAAACLIPKSEADNFLNGKKFDLLPRESQIEIIDDMKKNFLASGEVIIRRLHYLEYITWEQKESLIRDWNKYALRYRKDPFVPVLSQSQKCVNKNGKYYTQTVFSGISRGILTPERAVSYLGIKLRHFKELKGVVARM